MSGFYGLDAAHVHDTGHGEYAREAAPELLRRLGAAGRDLRRAGFGEVEARDAWGDLRLRPGHVAFAARRVAS